ncbi:alpha-methylacyl-CoA racemase [Sphingobium faniae]|nr:alpha-methylacyl-CoA racemase [Sphingobium faniae]
MSGPLSGLRIIEFASLGPGPFCAMMLADHGAEVIRLERPHGVYSSAGADPDRDVMLRSRRRLTVDVKTPTGLQFARKLCGTADGVIEGFRPGAMERLGLGPAELMAENPRLVYGRMTGWGQGGPLAQVPGHDINYVALSGVLHALGRAGSKPTPPVNLIGDYGGGLTLAFGMVAGLLSARQNGKGQVVDCAMVDSAALLGSILWTFLAQGNWDGPRGTNLFDTGAHHYDSYECADGAFVAVGPIEPQFYAVFRALLGVADDPDFDDPENPARWAAAREKLTRIFKTRPRAQWCELLENTEACVAPVLSPAEAGGHPHHVARGSFIQVAGALQPAPAPRFSDTQSGHPVAPGAYGKQELRSLLDEAGYSRTEADALLATNAVA